MDLLERDLTRTLKEENRTGNQNTAPAEPDLNFWSKPRVENTRKLVFDLGRDAARLARKFGQKLVLAEAAAVWWGARARA
jgi:hypothetical protein